MKKKSIEYAKYLGLVILIVLLIFTVWNSYNSITMPLGISELRGLEYLGMNPKQESCADCKETLLYRDNDTPTDCTITRLTSSNSIGNKAEKGDEYELVTQSVEDRLSRKGKAIYAFEIKAYKLFEQHCWPNDNEIPWE